MEDLFSQYRDPMELYEQFLLSTPDDNLDLPDRHNKALIMADKLAMQHRMARLTSIGYFDNMPF